MLHSFHCHYPPPQTPHSPSSQGKIVHKTKLSVHVSAERQSSRAGGLRLTVRHRPRVCIPRAGSRQASLAHTGHTGQGASLDFRNAKHSPCVRAGTQLCYANFKLWVKNLLAQISLSTRPLAQICPYIEQEYTPKVNCKNVFLCD